MSDPLVPAEGDTPAGEWDLVKMPDGSWLPVPPAVSAREDNPDELEAAIRRMQYAIATGKVDAGSDQAVDALADRVFHNAPMNKGFRPSPEAYAAVVQMLHQAGTTKPENWWAEMPAAAYRTNPPEVAPHERQPALPAPAPAPEPQRNRLDDDPRSEHVASGPGGSRVYMTGRPKWNPMAKRWEAPVQGGGQWQDPTQEGPR